MCRFAGRLSARDGGLQRRALLVPQKIERGFDARMIPANSVTPYRIQGRSGKNDANAAAAVCEAATRPHIIFVPLKTLAQHCMLCVHRLREGLKEEHTACINRIRGLLAGQTGSRQTRMKAGGLNLIPRNMNGDLQSGRYLRPYFKCNKPGFRYAVCSSLQKE